MAIPLRSNSRRRTGFIVAVSEIDRPELRIAEDPNGLTLAACFQPSRGACFIARELSRIGSYV